MGREIIKPNRDVDFYVEWSDNSDMPVAWGTRQDFLNEADAKGWGDRKEARMQRVDDTSRSALWHTFSWDEDFIEIVAQEGIIRRSQLPQLIETLDERGGLTEASRALLEPLED